MIVIPSPTSGRGIVYVAGSRPLRAMLGFAGTSWKQLTALVALFAVSITFVLVTATAMGVHVLKPYQVQRLTGFLFFNPSHDPRNQTYNILVQITECDRLPPEDWPGRCSCKPDKPAF